MIPRAMRIGDFICTQGLVERETRKGWKEKSLLYFSIKKMPIGHHKIRNLQLNQRLAEPAMDAMYEAISGRKRIDSLGLEGGVYLNRLLSRPLKKPYRLLLSL